VERYAPFRSRYRIDPGSEPGTPWRDPEVLERTGYLELAAAFAGVSFNRGLYRIHDAASAVKAQAYVSSSFPGVNVRVCGHSWLGIEFAVGLDDHDGQQTMVVLNAETREVTPFVADLVTFHDQILLQVPDLLDETLFGEWLATDPDRPMLRPDQCVTHRHPLVLGGSDTADNLEVVDRVTHWTVTD